ncbi:MAG: ribonuclease PH [Thermoanaerobaculia bacterium]
MAATFQRIDDRPADALRPVHLEIGAMKFAEGSALISVGDTRVLVSATIEDRVPPFLAGSGKGWMTAEYAMLPRATSTRTQREVTRGRPAGRSAEIQRLIGRSLRSAVDLDALGERTLILDCDVLQADGGTRTASITAAWAAAVQALSGLYLTRQIERWPLTDQVAAVSVGVVDGNPLLDLDAAEDQRAEVDLNVVATTGGHFIEIQGTGEKRPFARQELDDLLELARSGIVGLARLQDRALADVNADLAAAREQGTRSAASPKDERDLWGPPE